MTDDGILNRGFLAGLKSEYQRVRKHRANQLLDLASSDDAYFGAEMRRRYLNSALALDPNAMAAALYAMMCRDTSATGERIAAATLYLQGGDEGWWKIPAPAAKRARSLAKGKKDQRMNPTPRRTRSSRARVAAMLRDDGDNDISRYIAISRECLRMEAAVKEPAATDAAKIEAVERFFRIMDRLAPEESAAAFQKTLKAALTDYKTTEGVPKHD